MPVVAAVCACGHQFRTQFTTLAPPPRRRFNPLWLLLLLPVLGVAFLGLAIQAAWQSIPPGNRIQPLQTGPFPQAKGADVLVTWRNTQLGDSFGAITNLTDHDLNKLKVVGIKSEADMQAGFYMGSKTVRVSCYKAPHSLAPGQRGSFIIMSSYSSLDRLEITSNGTPLTYQEEIKPPDFYNVQ